MPSKPTCSRFHTLSALIVSSWGRILCAVGYSPLTASTISTPTLSEPLTIDPSRVSVSFLPADAAAPLHVLVKGEPEAVDEARASEVVGQSEITIEIDLGIGQESATYWTCDLSHVSLLLLLLFHPNAKPLATLVLQEYVTINGDYRS
jgi:N-acetylglutamate synthase/N-acetylornithine aminotransferase